MKEIYSFTVNKKVKVEQVEESDGVKTITQVDSVEPVKIIIKKPTREEAETADFESAKEYSRCVREKLLTNALVENLYNKDGYFKEQQAKIVELSNKLVDIQNEYQLIKTADSDEANTLRVKELETQWADLNSDLQSIRSSFDTIFANTAETRAKQKVLVWLTLFLTYQVDKDSAPRPVFKGNDYESKLKHYDALLDNDDPFFTEVASKAGYLVALWYDRKAAEKEDFDDALSLLDATFNQPTVVEPELQPEKDQIEPEATTTANT